MARQQRDKDDLDRAAWVQAHLQFERLQTHLPEDAVSHVAQEVVRRLAFRLPRYGAGTEGPTRADIIRFCSTLTAADDDPAERFIRNLRRAGSSAHTIYLSYIAAAARHLGEQWEEDEISFAEVTMASGRLFRIIRGLRYVLDRDGPQPADSRRILLAVLPGDSHTLASEMAADLFRRDGWDVDLAVGEDHDSIVGRADTTRFAAVVIVANAIRDIATLTRLVIGLRIAAPVAPLVVAGKILDAPDVAALCGADAAIASLDSAAARLRAITGLAPPRDDGPSAP